MGYLACNQQVAKNLRVRIPPSPAMFRDPLGILGQKQEEMLVGLPVSAGAIGVTAPLKPFFDL